MATIEPQTRFCLTSIEPTSIQPGGGLCVNVELAWGKLRRWFLRRFRPRYVQRMLAKRQGHCTNCPHDIIDPRDLKYYRNVCGYWFHAEDDPFRWRSQIRLARAGLVELMLFSLLFGSLTGASILAGTWLHSGVSFALVVILPLWIFVISFFRDPERRIPTDPDVLVCPADGTITHIDEVEESEFPDGRALRISIFLSVFNVHVNRIPSSGRITRVRYFPGKFVDARDLGCIQLNEQLWIDLEEAGSGRLIRVKQIAGAIARRIVCWLKPGELVHRGDRYGMIKFGSRTDLLLPASENVHVLVKVGEKVKGGSTKLIRFG